MATTRCPDLNKLEDDLKPFKCWLESTNTIDFLSLPPEIKEQINWIGCLLSLNREGIDYLMMR